MDNAQFLRFSRSFAHSISSRVKKIVRMFLQWPGISLGWVAPSIDYKAVEPTTLQEAGAAFQRRNYETFILNRAKTVKRLLLP